MTDKSSDRFRSGGSALVEQLAIEGARQLFMVPGESFLPVLDALHGASALRPITCRNEAGAAMMAEATGKLTGVPGVAIVTRGPGASNAMAGVYIAQHDASPMVLLIGMPPRDMSERAAFQDFEVTAIYGPLTKWCAIVPSASVLVEFISRAMRVAGSDRPGPVVLGLPEDVLAEMTDVDLRAKSHSARNPLSPDALDIIKTSLEASERPVIIVGGSTWSPAAAQGVAAFAERFDIPIVTSFRRQSHVDNRHPCYVGHAGLNMDDQLRAGLKIADCVLAIGARLGDVTSHHFKLFDGRDPGQRLIMISPDAEAPDTPYPHAEHIIAGAIDAVAALAELSIDRAGTHSRIWRRDLRQAYAATLKPLRTPGAVRMEAVVQHLSAALPDTAIVANGAGNYAAFLHRYFEYKFYPTQLAPTSGSMGYGLPAAIAAQLANPDRLVVAIAGDGCFQMTGQELATAVQFGLPIIVLIANNGALGTIRMHQEMRYPNRVVATSLMNPDFVALARAIGAVARRVTTTEAFPEALDEAIEISRDLRRPAVVELMIDIDAIAPNATLAELRRSHR